MASGLRTPASCPAVPNANRIRGDVMAGNRLTVIQCLACGHVATLRREADEMPLVRLTKRLVCSQCGARTMKAERQTGDIAPGRGRSVE